MTSLHAVTATTCSSARLEAEQQSVLRVSVVQSLLAESAKVLLTAVLWAVQC